MAQLNFDPRRVEPSQVFDPMPTSWYTGQIVESEMKDNSNKNGRYLELKIQVMGGDYNNRVTWDRLNLENPSQQAVDIAWRTLSAICHAVGLGQQEITDTNILHGRPFLVKINERPARTDPNTGTRYDASNEVKGYKAIDPTAAPVLGPSKAQQRPFTGAQYGGPGMGTQAGYGPQGAQQSPAGWGAPQGQPQPNNFGAQPQPNNYQPQPNGWGQPNPATGGAPAGWAGNGGAPAGWAGNGQQQPQPQYQTAPPQGYQQAQPGANPQPQYQPQYQTNPPQGGQFQPTPAPQAPPQQNAPQQAYQNTGTQPQSNVGNPALAAGAPPPWAMPQPQAQPQGGNPPPWVKQ